MKTAPALFIGHGSPMNAIEHTPAAQGWSEVAQRFAQPHAILVVSAHWVTDGVRVTANARPRTIHDFGRGFPQALFDVQYPAPGDPVLARRMIGLLAAFDAAADDGWGLDHGAWSVLRHMYPKADVPVLQLSLDARRSASEHFAIGRALAPLREDNVAILASGNIVHNLRTFFGREDANQERDFAFDEYIVDAAALGAHDAIVNYASHPAMPEANPDWEHFFPLFYALGVRKGDETPTIFNRYLEPGISMTSLAFGLPT